MMDRWGLEGMQSFEQGRLSELASPPSASAKDDQPTL